MLELFILLSQNLDAFLGAAGSIVVVASLVTAHTATPDPNSKLGMIYRVIEALALVYGKTKDKAE
ncbi:hypothetical protein GAY31_11365 [Azospirillum brasilense]|nr:hypothetical protein [Azospirillum brasilense]